MQWLDNVQNLVDENASKGNTKVYTGDLVHHAERSSWGCPARIKDVVVASRVESVSP